MACRVAVLLLLVVICIGFSAGEIAVDCCLSTSEKRIPRQNLSGYRIQPSGKGCDIGATIFITKKGMTICAPEASKAQWVKELIAFVNKKRQTR